MSYTFNPASTDDDELNIAAIRNEIDDESGSDAPGGGKKGVDYFLSDERIKMFVSSARDEAPADANLTEIRLWAASAAEGTLAKNQAFVLKKQTTMGESDDGPAVGAEIRAHAKSLADRAWKSLGERRKAIADAAQEAAQTNAEFAEPLGGSITLIPTL